MHAKTLDIIYRLMLGAYTARIELFKFAFAFSIGLFIWSLIMIAESSGSRKRSRKKIRGIILMSVSILGMLTLMFIYFSAKTNAGASWFGL